MDTRDWPYKTIAIGEDTHRQLAIAAAKRGVSMKDLAERLIERGLQAEQEERHETTVSLSYSNDR